MDKKMWAQSIQAQIAEYENTDVWYGEWCETHCRICGRELEASDLDSELLQWVSGTSPRERPRYPVEFPGGVIGSVCALATARGFGCPSLVDAIYRHTPVVSGL